jgi:hypothetical protein
MAKKDEQVLSPLSSEEMAALREQIAKELKDEIKKELLAAKNDDEVVSESEKNMEAQIAKQEKTLRQQLDEMPKVSIEIPEDPNNPDDVVPVGWNGIIYAIPRGQQFEVPNVIYDIWKESHKKTQEVNKRIRESITKEIQVL